MAKSRMHRNDEENTRQEQLPGQPTYRKFMDRDPNVLSAEVKRAEAVAAGLFATSVSAAAKSLKAERPLGGLLALAGSLAAGWVVARAIPKTQALEELNRLGKE